MEPDLITLQVKTFLETVSSEKPAPGGGSASALAGATAASLLSMFCKLTLGKKKFESAHEKTTEILAETEKIAKELIAAIDEDSCAYLGMAAAFAMPKTTPEETEARKTAIQQATRKGCDVPLKVAGESLRLLRLLDGMIPIGNASALSDAGCAVLLATAAAEGAALNVLINLKGNNEVEWAQSARFKIGIIRQEVAEIHRSLMKAIEERLG